MTALAGSIGTGNIVGVATGLDYRRAGGDLLDVGFRRYRYDHHLGEAVLAVKYRVKGKDGRFTGGPMYYLERGVGKKGLALLFAAACVLASFGMGNMAQSNAIAGALKEGFDLPSLLTGSIIAVLLFLISAGGLKGTAKVAEKLVPVMTLGYIGACLAILFFFSGEILPAFQLIFPRCLFFGSRRRRRWRYGDAPSHGVRDFPGNLHQ